MSDGDRRNDRGGDVETPPDGATCAEHPERTALAVCPGCSAYACLACWHDSVRRCHACLMRDPSAAAPPIPWEQRGRNAVARYVATLAGALQPMATAPGFARGGIGAAIGFWLLSFLPIAMLSRIIAFTDSLLFVDRLVLVPGSPSRDAIVIDVVRAIGLGALVAVIAGLALALPYLSLVHSYATGKNRLEAPMRLLLYRSFLVPLSALIEGLAVWMLPLDPGIAAITVVHVAAVIPLVLLFSAMRATARMGAGLGPLLSLATAIVPLLVMLIGQQFVIDALSSVPPSEDAVRAMVAAARGETP